MGLHGAGIAEGRRVTGAPVAREFRTVFSIFKRKPKFQDTAFAELAEMLWHDDSVHFFAKAIIEGITSGAALQ